MRVAYEQIGVAVVRGPDRAAILYLPTSGGNVLSSHYLNAGFLELLYDYQYSCNNQNHQSN